MAVALLGICAVVAAVLVGAGPASAVVGARAERVTPSVWAPLAANGYRHPTGSVIDGTYATQGPLGPSLGGRWGWCIQTGIPFWTSIGGNGAPVRTGEAPNIRAVRRPFLAANGLGWMDVPSSEARARVAWMMHHVESTNSSSHTDNAAVSLAAKLLWERGYGAGEGLGSPADASGEEVIQTHLRRMLDSFSGTGVVSAMRTLWDQGASNVSLDANTVTMTRDSSRWAGTVGGIGVRNAAGTLISGHAFTATLSGPARWVHPTGSSNPQVITGTTAASLINSLAWVGTGNGTARVDVQFDGTQPFGLGIRIMPTGQQSYLVFTEDGGTWSDSSAASTTVEFEFQPGVTTVARDGFLNEGQAMVDRVTGHSAVAGENWVRGPGGAYLPVVVEVGTYGPFAREQVQTTSADRTTVPASDRDGNPVHQVARHTGTLTGPGASIDVTTGNAPASGYFIHVARVIRSQQPESLRQHIRGDYWDGWAMPDETFITRMRLDVATSVPAESRHISAGAPWNDLITLAPVTTGGLWLAPNGVPLEIPMIAEIHGPFDYVGQDRASQHATVTQTVRWVADRYGTQILDDVAEQTLRALPYSGFYTINARVDQARFAEIDARRSGETIRIAGDTRPIRIADFLDARDHAAEHGWWQPAQTLVVRMQPQVVTQVSNRVIDESDLPAVLDDAITLSLARDGDRWLHTGGPSNPVPVVIDVDNFLYGPFDMPQDRGPWSEVPATFLEHRLDGDAPLAFTEVGTRLTSETDADYAFATVHPDQPRGHRNTAASRLGPFGFYTWTSHIEANSQWFDSYDTDFWVEEETHTVRREVDKFSIVQDTNLTPGGRFADYLYLGNFPATQGGFAGLGGWNPDTDTARVRLYGPFNEEPNQDHADDDSPVFATVEVPAGATSLVGDFPQGEAGSAVHRFEIGFGKWTLPRVPMSAAATWGTDDAVPWQSHDDGTQTATAHFVFVYEFDGDDRTVAFNSRLNDDRQMASVTFTRTMPPAPPLPPTGEQPPGEDPPTGEQDPLGPRVTTIAVAIEPGRVNGGAAGGGTGTGNTGTGSTGAGSESDEWRDVRGSAQEGVGILGDYLRDRIEVCGAVPEGSYLLVDLFFNEPGDALTDANLMGTSQRIVIDSFDDPGCREYRTETFGPTDRVGVWHFRERLYAPGTAVDGEPGSGVEDAPGAAEDTPGAASEDRPSERITEGRIGEPSETVYIIRPSTTAGFEDRNNSGTADVGDYFFDDIHVEGELPEGVNVAMWASAYRVPHAGVNWPASTSLTASTPVIPGTGLVDGSRAMSDLLGTYAVRASWSGPGTYRTDGFILTPNAAFGLGALTWMEHVIITNPDDPVTSLDSLPARHIRVDGQWGVVEETLAPVNHRFASPGNLAATGADLIPWLVGVAGLALLAWAVLRMERYADVRTKVAARFTSVPLPGGFA